MSIYLVHYANAQQKASAQARARRRTVETPLPTEQGRVWRRIIGR